ncbi:mitogen-activated protein kinase kinase kinase 12-like isoform X1 [Leptidea sinapis]|uniref:mitogen-activated protein kinase kinase kinase 12-like isoform X1 n=3 Tax=Leptidea sinapis TaxID=189913 RepID=UPI0021C2B6CD|nr:mitogen-activated protein kinase kinase kinase 12-like isoform X1 [Leptidea sinapis]XP_050683414.1 mitogen-activated protein kinase kinase kinase 12-like isoform X1 [Leptidea sinapis]
MDQPLQPENDAEVNKDNAETGVPWYEDKKNFYWMGGIFECLTSVVSLFSTNQLKEEPENWEIPMEKITDLFFLGSGGQGTVYGAQLNGKRVAVKQLHTKTETNMKHLLKLQHENIVKFIGVCTSPPQFCVIMEYCQYGSLYDFIHSNTTFAPKQLLKWAKEIAVGMVYLHGHKIIHRDLKSPNILISDDLVVKVSDFGTSCVWNDISAVMTFTGTVAWMAPEIIRHEPCSLKVDVWSFGVMLWEILTAEKPYKGLETQAIMWGVGTNSISLPIPSNCPNSLQQLLKQCWNRVPRDRPTFKIIAGHLEIAGGQLRSMNTQTFTKVQNEWRADVHKAMEIQYSKNLNTVNPESDDVSDQRREDLKQARDLRHMYEQQVTRANELFMEVCAVRLQLEQREKTLAEKEIVLNECRCGVRNSKVFQRQQSSSSEGMKLPVNHDSQRRRKKISLPAQMVVSFDDNKSRSLTTLDDHASCPCNAMARSLMPARNTDVTIKFEDNGNQASVCRGSDSLNDNNIPDVAQV